MTFAILRGHDQVRPYVAAAKAAADSNRSALGFLPAAVYDERSLRGQLWIVVSAEQKEYKGHLLFGGSYPDLKIVQLFVDPSCRAMGLATRLLQELAEYGQLNDFIAITARVATDLPANDFWERCGFIKTRTIPGGRTTERLINIRVKALDVPRLFDLPVYSFVPNTTIAYETRPILSTPQYALDVNVILDLIRSRKARSAVSSLVRAAFNHIFQVVVTEETNKELVRNSPSEQGADPLLAFIRELPTLPAVERSNLDTTVEELRTLVFPGRSRSRRDARQDESDLVHLAICVHHNIDGFVTSERAMLRAAQQVKARFSLNIVSPFDFMDSNGDGEDLPMLSAITHQAEIRFCWFEESRRQELEKFMYSLGTSDGEVKEALSPGTQGRDRRRLFALIDGEVAAVASWSRHSKFRKETAFYFYLDESKREVQRVVDHVFEVLFRDQDLASIFGIHIIHGAGQSITRSTALKRGFRSAVRSDRDTVQPLYKVGVAGTITNSTWLLFAKEIDELASIRVQDTMPTFEAIKNGGLKFEQQQSRVKGKIELFDLETLISPGLFMFSGRQGAVIPIKEKFANELLGGVSPQLSFLPGHEALLRLEKAYFRNPNYSERLVKGMPLVFYVSGRGGRAIGHARLTSSTVLPVNDVVRQYERQGVLSAGKLSEIADKRGRVHVLTFDNFAQFPQSVPFRQLKALGCVDRMNFITVTTLGAEQFTSLISAGYSVKSKK